jgi:kynureninase
MTWSDVPIDPDYARKLDAQDELAAFRGEFVVDDPDLIYLDGNSLGRLPKRVRARLQEVVDREWGRRLVRGWGEGWFTAPERVGAKIAQLVGAEPDEVIVTDSTSVDLMKLLSAALEARQGRHTIVTDDLNFPSDLYIAQGVLRRAGPGYRLERVRSPDGMTMPLATLAEVVNEDTAVVMLTHTAFKSGFVYDMAAVTELAHQVGAWMLWDLSHSVGAMPLALDASNVDLAVGCTYKYLNGGPGAPAFLFVHRSLQGQLHNPISGWWGQKDPFDFALDYRPAHGIQRFLSGTPPVLSLAAIEPSVEVILEAGLDRIRAKSVGQTEYLIALWERVLQPYSFTLNSPRDPSRRGSHVSLGHPDGLRIDRALIEAMHVIPDFRYPDNIRLGVAPLYTSFSEIHEGIMRLKRVMDERLYEKYPSTRPDVT